MVFNRTCHIYLPFIAIAQSMPKNILWVYHKLFLLVKLIRESQISSTKIYLIQENSFDGY